MQHLYWLYSLPALLHRWSIRQWCLSLRRNRRSARANIGHVRYVFTAAVVVAHAYEVRSTAVLCYAAALLTVCRLDVQKRTSARVHCLLRPFATACNLLLYSICLSA